MRDGSSKGGFRLRAFGVDMDELPVFGDVGEGVDLGLSDLEPAGDAHLLSDHIAQLVHCAFGLMACRVAHRRFLRSFA